MGVNLEDEKQPDEENDDLFGSSESMKPDVPPAFSGVDFVGFDYFRRFWEILCR